MSERKQNCSYDVPRAHGLRRAGLSAGLKQTLRGFLACAGLSALLATSVCAHSLTNINDTGQNICSFQGQSIHPVRERERASVICPEGHGVALVSEGHVTQHSGTFSAYAAEVLSAVGAVLVWLMSQLGHVLPSTGVYQDGGKILIIVSELLGAYVLLRLFLKYRRWRKCHRAMAAGKKLISSLAERLQIRRKQLVYQNIYGTTIYDKWEREKKEFMQREMLNCLRERGYEAYFERVSDGLSQYIDKVAFDESTPVVAEVKKPTSPDVYSPDMDPFDYERYCGLILRQAGWEAIVTSESGDQGADIVATRGRLRLVVQCKLYSRPVGNDAVQQVVAARQHYGARFGAVVSNASYTTAAQQLARTNKVSLLHHDELLQYVRRLERAKVTRLRQ